MYSPGILDRYRRSAYLFNRSMRSRVITVDVNGKVPEMQFRMIDTAWGTFGFVAKEKRLLATFLPQSERTIRRAIKDQFPDAIESKSLLPRFCRDVRDYFAGKAVAFQVTLDLAHLPVFRQAVLAACHRIPFGKTASYADLARAVGKPGAARAVGGAMAGNPLPLVVPCHRVLRSDGSLGGFSSPRGVEQKRRLLRIEGVVTVGQAA